MLIRFFLKTSFSSLELKSVLGRLTSQPISPHHRARPRHDNLSTLLEDEKLHGTRERDATAPRPDYHYFSRGSFFVLCEDATGEYRTILAKEYEKPKGGAEPEWPVLHSNFLRPSANAIAKTEAAAVAAAAAAAAAKDAADAAKSVSGAGVGVETRTAAAMKRKALFPYAAATTMDPKSRLAAVKDGATGAGDLRRSVSLNNLGKLAATPVPTITTPETHYNGRRGGHDDSHDAYIAASGNSVNITSTITSAQSGTGHNPGGAGNVGLTDRGRRIVELNKRVVPMTRGTSAATVAAPENADTATSRAAAAVGDEAACGNGDVRMVDLEDSDRSATKPLTGAQAAAMIADAAEQELKRKTRIMVDHVKRTLGADEPGKGKTGAGAVGKMEPPPVKKRNSLPGGFERREHNTVRLPVREESKKPGYCENCRMKFDDFSQVSLRSSLSLYTFAASNVSSLYLPSTSSSASIAASPRTPTTSTSSTLSLLDFGVSQPLVGLSRLRSLLFVRRSLRRTLLHRPSSRRRGSWKARARSSTRRKRRRRRLTQRRTRSDRPKRRIRMKRNRSSPSRNGLRRSRG